MKIELLIVYISTLQLIQAGPIPIKALDWFLKRHENTASTSPQLTRSTSSVSAGGTTNVPTIGSNPEKISPSILDTIPTPTVAPKSREEPNQADPSRQPTASRSQGGSKPDDSKQSNVPRTTLESSSREVKQPKQSDEPKQPSENLLIVPIPSVASRNKPSTNVQNQNTQKSNTPSSNEQPSNFEIVASSDLILGGPTISNPLASSRPSAPAAIVPIANDEATSQKPGRPNSAATDLVLGGPVPLNPLASSTSSANRQRGNQEDVPAASGSAAANPPVLSSAAVSSGVIAKVPAIGNSPANTSRLNLEALPITSASPAPLPAQTLPAENVAATSAIASLREAASSPSSTINLSIQPLTGQNSSGPAASSSGVIAKVPAVGNSPDNTSRLQLEVLPTPIVSAAVITTSKSSVVAGNGALFGVNTAGSSSTSTTLGNVVGSVSGISPLGTAIGQVPAVGNNPGNPSRIQISTLSQQNFAPKPENTPAVSSTMPSPTLPAASPQLSVAATTSVIGPAPVLLTTSTLSTAPAVTVTTFPLLGDPKPDAAPAQPQPALLPSSAVSTSSTVLSPQPVVTSSSGIQAASIISAIPQPQAVTSSSLKLHSSAAIPLVFPSQPAASLLRGPSAGVSEPRSITTVMITRTHTVSEQATGLAPQNPRPSHSNKPVPNPSPSLAVPYMSNMQASEVSTITVQVIPMTSGWSIVPITLATQVANVQPTVTVTITETLPEQTKTVYIISTTAVK